MSDDQPITHNLSPSHPLNNRHHNGGYRDEQDYYESMFDRGPGDPDVYGYPGQPDDAVLICRSSDDEKWSDVPF